MVRSPFSVSSFAAQPPEIPEPTTMASYVAGVTGSGGRSERHVAVVAVEEHPRLQDVPLHRPGGEIAVHRERLQTAEGVAGTGLFGARGVERGEELRLPGGRQTDEMPSPSRIDVGETGEKRGLLVVARPLAQNQIDELRHLHARRAGRLGLRDDHLGDVRDQRLLSGVQRAEGNVLTGEAEMELLAERDRGLGGAGEERQRQRGAEEAYDFASVHARTAAGRRAR